MKAERDWTRVPIGALLVVVLLALTLAAAQGSPAQAPPPGPALAVGVNDSADPVYEDDRVRYEITVRNEGASAAEAVELDAAFSRRVRVLSASADRGSCVRRSDGAACELGRIVAGGSRSVDLVAKPRVAGNLRLAVEALAAGAAEPATGAERTRVRERPRCLGRAATIIGTNKGERIRGTGRADVIFAAGGNDRIDGRGGKDRICGERGSDRIKGRRGGDRIDGGPGADLLKGGRGRDRSKGGRGADEISGGSGRDRANGQGGRDTVSGGSGGDRLAGGDGIDLLSGGPGGDRQAGNGDDDELVGGPGRDRLNGGGGQDWCQSGERLRGCNSSRGFAGVGGKGRKAGSGGRRYTYSVLVERGIAVERKGIARTIERVLGDRRSWIASGRVSFRRVSSGGSTQVYLASPSNVDRLCAPLRTNGEVSCSIGSRVVLNVDRWRGAVPHWPKRNVNSYRKMLINHEVGHRIGQGHRNCPGGGRRAPVMQQQTYGLQGCKANPWPLPSELASLSAAPARASALAGPRRGYVE